MDTCLSDYLSTFRDKLIQFLWKEWCVLGVAGVSDDRGSGRWFIDPEMLLAISLSLARWDARVFDEILDWLLVNGEWVNVSRLATIIQSDGIGDIRLVQAVASAVVDHGRKPRWNQMAHSRPVGTTKPRPLFLAANRRHPETVPLDESFLKYGFKRTSFKARAMSRSVPVGDPRCLVFRVRALFGVNVRADLLAHLIVLGEDYPTQASRTLGFSQKQVQDTLVELAESGVVHVRKVGGRKIYSVDTEQWWGFLYGSYVAGAKHLDWRALVRALNTLLQGLERAASKSNSSYIASSAAREAMEQARPDLIASRLGAPVTEGSLYQGGAYLQVFVRDLMEIVARLEGDCTRSKASESPVTLQESTDPSKSDALSRELVS